MQVIFRHQFTVDEETWSRQNSKHVYKTNHSSEVPQDNLSVVCTAFVMQ